MFGGPICILKATYSSLVCVTMYVEQQKALQLIQAAVLDGRLLCHMILQTHWYLRCQC